MEGFRSKHIIYECDLCGDVSGRFHDGDVFGETKTKRKVGIKFQQVYWKGPVSAKGKSSGL